jgi:hypothetical protein
MKTRVEFRDGEAPAEPPNEVHASTCMPESSKSGLGSAQLTLAAGSQSAPVASFGSASVALYLLAGRVKLRLSLRFVMLIRRTREKWVCTPLRHVHGDLARSRNEAVAGGIELFWMGEGFILPRVRIDEFTYNSQLASGQRMMST